MPATFCQFCRQINKVECVFPMIVDSILPHAERKTHPTLSYKRHHDVTSFRNLHVAQAVCKIAIPKRKKTLTSVNMLNTLSKTRYFEIVRICRNRSLNAVFIKNFIEFVFDNLQLIEYKCLIYCSTGGTSIRDIA